MKGEYIRATITAIIPGGIFGFLIYAIVSQGMLVIACVFAGVVLAIATGVIHYLRQEKEEPSEN